MSICGLIFIYGQAGTYHQLGIVAHEEQDFAEALRDYSLAMEIWLQYNDEYNAKITIGNLGILLQDWEPPAGAIAGLEISDQVKEILKELLEEIRKKPVKKKRKEGKKAKSE